MVCLAVRAPSGTRVPNWPSMITASSTRTSESMSRDANVVSGVRGRSALISSLPTRISMMLSVMERMSFSLPVLRGVAVNC